MAVRKRKPKVVSKSLVARYKRLSLQVRELSKEVRKNRLSILEQLIEEKRVFHDQSDDPTILSLEKVPTRDISWQQEAALWERRARNLADMLYKERGNMKGLKAWKRDNARPYKESTVYRLNVKPNPDYLG